MKKQALNSDFTPSTKKTRSVSTAVILFFFPMHRGFALQTETRERKRNFSHLDEGDKALVVC